MPTSSLYIYIYTVGVFTIQIVSKQLYSTKQKNSVSKEPKQQSQIA